MFCLWNLSKKNISRRIIKKEKKKKNFRNKNFYNELIKRKKLLKTKLKNKFCFTLVLKKYKKKEEMEKFHGKFPEYKNLKILCISGAVKHVTHLAVKKLEMFMNKEVHPYQEKLNVKKVNLKINIIEMLLKHNKKMVKYLKT